MQTANEALSLLSYIADLIRSGKSPALAIAFAVLSALGVIGFILVVMALVMMTMRPPVPTPFPHHVTTHAVRSIAEEVNS